MSLAKIPFIFLYGLGAHVAFSPPNPPTPKKQQIMSDGPVEVHLAVFVIRHASWVHVAIELAIILAAAFPNSKVAKSVLTFLLPGKDPSRIFLSPMRFFATALMVAGAIIRMQCYREMGKNFTLQVTILKEHKLIMSGPYSYVRHPSYTGIYLCFAGMTIWCVVQGSWLRESEVYKVPLAWLALAPVMINILLIAAAPFRRIPTEDEMLKKTFGKEWDEWARKVPARLVPGIY